MNKNAVKRGCNPVIYSDWNGNTIIIFIKIQGLSFVFVIQEILYFKIRLSSTGAKSLMRRERIAKNRLNILFEKFHIPKYKSGMKSVICRTRKFGNWLNFLKNSVNVLSQNTTQSYSEEIVIRRERKVENELDFLVRKLPYFKIQTGTICKNKAWHVWREMLEIYRSSFISKMPYLKKYIVV